jgi:formate dehydrogenase iron-sulfur subunit
MTTTAFLTDATLCIGCKACEVACKEWNDVPADGMDWSGLSYDNTKALGASTWRHVLFLEQPVGAGPQLADTQDPFRWVFLSDVCKHCANAGCLEACPTGAIVRTEVGSVYVQPDICNGCGYCVVSCPFGVVEKRHDDGRAFKCTFCYDRQKVNLMPACATACPTQSIQFGPLDELKARAKNRVDELQHRGYSDARVYDPQETSVGGIHAFFVILGQPENYNLPPAPEVPTVYLKSAWTSALVSAAVLFAIVYLAFGWR